MKKRKGKQAWIVRICGNGLSVLCELSSYLHESLVHVVCLLTHCGGCLMELPKDLINYFSVLVMVKTHFPTYREDEDGYRRSRNVCKHDKDDVKRIGEICCACV